MHRFGGNTQVQNFLSGIIRSHDQSSPIFGHLEGSYVCSTPKNNGLSISPPTKLDENFDYTSHNRMLRAASEQFERRQQARKEMRSARFSQASAVANESKASNQAGRKSKQGHIKEILARFSHYLSEFFGGNGFRKSPR